MRRLEREAILDGKDNWECRGTNMKPSIVRKNDTEPLEIEVRDVDVVPGNHKEKIATTHGGAPCTECLRKVSEEQHDWRAAPSNVTSTSIALPPHVSKLTTCIG